jgi:uncharacterized protein YcbK (DUF882 family)
MGSTLLVRSTRGTCRAEPSTMTLRRLAIVVTIAVAGSLAVPADLAFAKSKRGKTKVCSRVDGKRRCRWVREFQGHNAQTSSLRAEPVKPSGNLHIYSRNVREEVKVNLYREDGDFDDAALAALDHLFRCHRSGKTRAVDPKLYEVLSAIYDHFGQRLELTSGFRFYERSSSRHANAAAADVGIKGVSARAISDFAATLDAGGMGIGYYPRSGFVHIDRRAPGAQSYRWTDYGSSSSKSKSRPKSKKKREVKPNT